MFEIIEHAPLGAISTFQLGGTARYAVTVSNQAELEQALAYAREHALRYRVLGGGSNLLVPDAGFEGLIIWYRDKFVEIDPASGRVRAGAGATTAQVAGMTARVGLTGFEWAAGVPGTIGGAVYGNAGASGGEMKDSVTAVTVLEDGEVRTYNNQECRFAYRHSHFKDHDVIILCVELHLAHAADPKDPYNRVIEVLKYRAETQPKGVASTGCIFKNAELDEVGAETLRSLGVPEQFLAVRRVPAGWLIEHAGLKGLRVGGAQVSDVHGNFIVNSGGATATDVEQLILQVRDAVQERFGIELHPEITILH